MAEDKEAGKEPKKPLKTNDALTHPPPRNAPPNRTLAPRGMVGTERSKAATPGPQSMLAQQRAAEKAQRERDKADLKGIVRGDRARTGPTILKKDFDRVR